MEFDRFTEQSSSSLAKVFWLSKESEGKAGALIVSKLRECMPEFVKEFIATKMLDMSGNTCDFTEFGDFLTSSLGKLVDPVEQEAFYKPQRLDHAGKPVKQEGKVVVKEVKKVRLAMSGVNSRKLQSKNPCVSNKVKDLKTSSMVMRK